MSGICDTNKSMPDSSSSLTTVPKAGFFDITGRTKLTADHTIDGSSEGSIKYTEKIDQNEIPYLNYTDLKTETGNIFPIATASAAIRTSENSYVVFYPSYYNALSGQTGTTSLVQIVGDTSEPLGQIEKNTENKVIKSFNGKTYTIYIIPTNTPMSGGAVQYGGSLDAYKDILNAQDGKSHTIDEIRGMVTVARDMPDVVPAVVPVVAPAEVVPTVVPVASVASKYIVAQKSNLYFDAGAEQRFTLQEIFGRNVDPTKVSFMCSFVGIEGDNILEKGNGRAVNNFRANLDCKYDGTEISILYKSWDNSKLKQCGVTLTAFAIPILSGGNYKIKYSI